MRNVLPVLVGLLLGWAFAQSPSGVAQKESASEFLIQSKDPSVAYLAVVQLRDHKPGTEVEPRWAEAQTQILSKHGIYGVQLLQAKEAEWTLQLVVRSDMPISDLEEVLRAYLGQTLSLTRKN